MSGRYSERGFRSSRLRTQDSLVPGQITVEPGLDEHPASFDRSQGQVQGISNLGMGEFCENAHRCDLCKLRIVFFETMEGIIDIDMHGVIEGGAISKGLFVECDAASSASMFDRSLSPGVFNKDVPHGLCSEADEMRCAFPLGHVLLRHANQGFVCECGGLKRLAWSKGLDT